MKGLLFFWVLLQPIQSVLSQFSNFTKDGKYFVLESIGNKRSFILQNESGNWSREIINVNNLKFSSDSKSAYYLVNGSLHVMQLGTGKIDSIVNVASFDLEPLSNKKDLLLYKVKSAINCLVIQYPRSPRREIEGVVEYRFMPANEQIVIQTKRNTEYVLSTLDSAGNSREIWSDTMKIISWLADVHKPAIAFMTAQKHLSGNIMHELFYYHGERNQLRKIISDSTESIRNLFEISVDNVSVLSAINKDINTATCPFAFIDEGNGLLLYLKEKVQPLAQKTGPGKDVDIWSYFDPVFQTAQLASTNLRRKLAFSINLRTDQINRLEQDDELIVYGNHDASTRFFILYKYKRDVLQKEENYGNGISTFYSTKEFNWNSALEPDVFLISSEDGSRKILRKQVRPFADDLPPFYLSPNGKYVVQFCGTDRHYYSYEILSGIWRKLTNDINVPLELGGNVANHVIADYYKPAGIVRWERDSLCLLIKDYYSDIWRVSLTAQKPSVCITGGFAKRNNVDLSVNGLENFSNSLIDSTVFLKVSWNNKNTQNRHKNPGFYSLNLYTRLLKPLIKEKGTIFYSIQSRHANKMVLKKQHSDKPESYVFAENFKELRDLKSSLPDQQVGPAVNKEFMSWKTFDGLECYGMLYKPKDFDPSKKYPVIVTYYELLSFDQRKLFELEGDERYKYHSYFLENGYLVFESEIYQEKMGQTCYNAYNCVVPGVKMLLKRIYIDPKRIGINGHSFGGYETNCLITQTNLFAAAVARSGISNMISMALGDIPGSKSIRTSSTLAETGQNRMGTTIWKNLDVYIANSPVLHADKVNTPLLLLHSKDDYNVPYLQSVEMFKALRRLGKKVWLISGDSGGHGGPKFWGQYMIQFFDYYLKGLAPRKWMTEGVPASQKGIADPFEVDIENSSPPQPTIYDKEAVIPIQVKDKVRKQ